LAAAPAAGPSGDVETCRDQRLKTARIEACDRLIAAHGPRDAALAALYDLRAAAHSDLSNDAAAAEDMGRALRLRPASAEAFVKRGAAYDSAGDAEAALRDLNEAVVLGPKNASARVWRGRLYRKLEQLANAEADLTAAIALDPKDANAWLVRGLTRDDLKRHNEAIADYDKAASLAPDSIWPLYNRAWSKLRLDRAKDALADLDACQKIEPDMAACFDLRGDALSALSDFKGAAAAYTQAIARDPQTAQRYKSRANVLRKLGDYDAAIRDLTRAYEIDGEMQTLYERGWIYAMSGRPDDAIADYSRVLRREGVDAWQAALIERGLARWIQGDLKSAAEDFGAVRITSSDDASVPLWRTALTIRLTRDSFWASWRRSDAIAALARQRTTVKGERYETPFVQALLGERSLGEAHRVAHMAAKQDKDPQVAACFVDAMAGALALADGDAGAAETYFAKAAARNYRPSFSCMIASAELNRLRSR
jgi:tetratricopeptide (TPR) repeat protein